MPSLRTIIIAGIVLLVSFAGATLAMQMLTPAPVTEGRPALAEIPPLPQITRTSVIITPAVISLSAIRDAMEANAPRDFSGRRDNPFTQLLSNADIGWTISRGPLTVSGRPEALAVSTVLNGALRVTGQVAGQAGNVAGAIGGLFSENLGKGMQGLTGKAIDQRADIRGNVTITSRPALTTNWRLEPNLTAQVSIADAALSIIGVKLSVTNEVKPLLDRQVGERVALLQARLRNDPFIEQAARREWTKMCRSVPLGVASGMPKLWLEVRPTRAFAAQPRIDAANVTLTIGVQAETRITPAESKPDCPFPATLDLVPPMQQGRVNIAVPIDVPFSEVNRLLELQLTGRTFPEDKSGPFEVTIGRVSLAASGNRLLISLRVKARETKSWFGLGSEATVHVWGKPQLDRERQILRLTDTAIDVESEAAFGLLGTAARAAVPYLETALAEHAVIDLKPFAANARKSIEAALADFRMSGEGVQADATVTDLRLVGIEFDSHTLRIIAEVDGTTKIAITALPK
jgi:hypothetical protein